jgi:hypothetical protein
MTHRFAHALVVWLTLALASQAAWAAGPPELMDGPLKSAREQQQGLLNAVRNRLWASVNKGELSNTDANDHYGKIAEGVRDGFKLGDERSEEIDRLSKKYGIENTGSKPKNVGAEASPPRRMTLPTRSQTIGGPNTARMQSRRTRTNTSTKSRTPRFGARVTILHVLPQKRGIRMLSHWRAGASGRAIRTP